MNTTLPDPITTNLWFFEIVVGVFVLMAVNYVFKRVVRHARRRSLSHKQGWREKIDHILFLPFQILLWIMGATLVMEVLGDKFDFSFFEKYLDSFRSSGFVLCSAWALLRWKAELQRDFLNKKKHGLHIDAGFMQVIGRISSVGILVLSLMITLQVWGLNIGPLIAFGGIGAAAMGYAAKDVIASFFGGFMVHINRPFMTGDYIYLPEQKVEGNVEEIGWFLTCVRDKEKRPVYLPNSIFSDTLVVNGSRMTHRRIEGKFWVRYEDFSRLNDLTENIRLAISKHSDIDTHLPVLVVLNGFDQYSLEIYIDVYTLQTKYDKWQRVKNEVLTLVYEEVQKAGAEMPSLNLALSWPMPGGAGLSLSK